MAKPSASRRLEAKSAASDNRNLAMAVVDVVRRSNLPMELFVPNRAEVLDMTINAPGKERVGIQCYQSAVVNSSRAVLAWIAKVEQLKRPVKEVWLVGRHVPSEVREWLDPYEGFEVVELSQLERWLDRYKRPGATRTESTSRIVVKARANHEQIVLLSTSLKIQIDERLAALKQQKPNSTEATAQRDAAISDYEQLRDKVDALQLAVAQLVNAEMAPPAFARTAKSWSDGVGAWWSKRHTNILDKSADMAIVLSSVAVCSLLGVSANVAAVAATALVGGKSVAGALRGILRNN